MKLDLRLGDCLDLMRDIPDASVDMICTDLPYGYTACAWDAVIPFDAIWKQYKRIIRGNGAIVLNAAQPFTSALVMSNPKGYRHAWVWNKQFAANYPQAKRQPMRVHEDILVFGNERTVTYYPQMTERDTPIKKGANKGGTIFTQDQGLMRADYAGKVYTEKYPESIVHINIRSEARGLHPTQKPVALISYLIETYTKPGDTVLDSCMGSGTTGVACMALARRFIGIEKDESYFKIASDRIRAAVPQAANDGEILRQGTLLL